MSTNSKGEVFRGVLNGKRDALGRTPVEELTERYKEVSHLWDSDADSPEMRGMKAAERARARAEDTFAIVKQIADQGVEITVESFRVPTAYGDGAARKRLEFMVQIGWLERQKQGRRVSYTIIRAD